MVRKFECLTFLLDIHIEHGCFSSESAVYLKRIETPLAAWVEITGASA